MRLLLLSGAEVERHFRTTLCDKDPGVMCAALCALHDLVGVNPAPYRNLIPSLTSILKQVSEHRLPKAYDYHRFPAPFIQVCQTACAAVCGAMTFACYGTAALNVVTPASPCTVPCTDWQLLQYDTLLHTWSAAFEHQQPHLSA